MAYNSYFPATYQPQMYAPAQVYPQQNATPQPSAQTQTTNRWDWVQGEMGAKSYLVAPNTTVLLLDSEGQKFYLKSADASGMPLPLRTFTYTEEAQATATATIMPTAEYATKAEIAALTRRVDALTHKEEAANDE